MKIIDKEKTSHGSGENFHRISGWLKLFFLYNNSDTVLKTFKEKDLDYIDILELKKSYVKAPVKLKIDLGGPIEEHDLQYFAGFLGVLNQNLNFRPNLTIGFLEKEKK